MTDPATCDHEWKDEETLEVFPPVYVSRCVKCGMRRHTNSATGAVTLYPPSPASADPSTSVSSRRPPDAER